MSLPARHERQRLTGPAALDFSALKFSTTVEARAGAALNFSAPAATNLEPTVQYLRNLNKSAAVRDLQVSLFPPPQPRTARILPLLTLVVCAGEEDEQSHFV